MTVTCSGGQRKRVNIGLELVARPSVLFMVSPASPHLDAPWQCKPLYAIALLLSALGVMMLRYTAVLAS